MSWELHERKARKVHRCDWCSGAIQKKEIYSAQTCASEGKLFSLKLHIDCTKAWAAIPAGEYEDFEELWGYAERGHLHESNYGHVKGCPACEGKSNG